MHEPRIDIFNYSNGRRPYSMALNNGGPYAGEADHSEAGVLIIQQLIVNDTRCKHLWIFHRRKKKNRKIWQMDVARRGTCVAAVLFVSLEINKRRHTVTMAMIYLNNGMDR